MTKRAHIPDIITAIRQAATGAPLLDPAIALDLVRVASAARDSQQLAGQAAAALKIGIADLTR